MCPVYQVEVERDTGRLPRLLQQLPVAHAPPLDLGVGGGQLPRLVRHDCATDCAAARAPRGEGLEGPLQSTGTHIAYLLQNTHPQSRRNMGGHMDLQT